MKTIATYLYWIDDYRDFIGMETFSTLIQSGSGNGDLNSIKMSWAQKSLHFDEVRLA